MTDDPANEDFEYMAHRRGDTQKDMFYIGAYLGYVADNKLRSLSGKTPSYSITLGTFRNYTHNLGAPNGTGGSGYDMFGWYQLIFLQCMYVLKYKNLNSQSTVGFGSTVNSTGGTVTWGMDKKNGNVSSNSEPMKLFGIEHLWGNIFQFIDGFVSNDNRHILTATENFNDSGSGYTDRGEYAQEIGWTWAKSMMGTTHRGFTITQSGASNSTHYCDTNGISKNAIVSFGSSGDSTGIFQIHTNIGTSFSRNDFGSRLMYL